jgi:hypothetical protein
MTYLYWYTGDSPRIFNVAQTPKKIKEMESLGIPEGECVAVGRMRVMRLPDKPILARDGADSVLEPAPSPQKECEKSDLMFF